MTNLYPLPAGFPEGSHLDRDEDAPMLWAVWLDDEILGAGDTSDAAIADAREQLQQWKLNAYRANCAAARAMADRHALLDSLMASRNSARLEE